MSATASMKHTRIPNDLLDKHMADMGIAELKVVLFAMRQTLGYHRASDAISLSQFVKATGLSRQGVLDGIEAAKKRGMLCEVSRGKRGVVVYAVAVELETPDEKPATSQASRPDKPVDQSSKEASTSQASRPDKPATSQASRHTKERVLKENFKDKEIKESARDSDPTPYHIANGLGSNGKRNDNALVLAIKEHPAYQAFVAGWDGIMPEVNPRNAETTWDGLNYLQREIDAGHLSYRDIEDVTRWKVSNPRTQGYQVIYVKVDLPAFKAAMRAEANRKPPARAAPNGNGAHAPPAPAPAHKPSEGVSGLKARLKAEQQAKQGG